jgi:hypothetical protein
VYDRSDANEKEKEKEKGKIFLWDARKKRASKTDDAVVVLL